MKRNNGVSLITLVITIVVMLILISISIYYGFNKNIIKSSEANRYTEIINLSEAISQRALFNRTNPDRFPIIGEKLTSANTKTINDIVYGEGWYYVTAEDSTSLNLESVNGNYIVNYTTGEVIATNPIMYNNQTYYSSLEIKKAVLGENQAVVSSGMFDEQKSVNKPILVDGMIPVKNVAGKWIITNQEDSEWYDYSSENKIWANVMMLDEISVTDMTNEQIRLLQNPISELSGKEVTSNGSMFVWLPRFSSNGTSIVYSKLLEDYLEDGYALHSAFTNSALSGIWISKYDASIIE